MKLKELLNSVALACDEDREIHFVSNNIEKCDAQTLFVAIHGSMFDSHIYTKVAQSKGAYTMSNYGMGGDIEVVDTRKYYGRLILGLQGNPQDFLTFIGVSGTNGKSSVGYTIFQGLEEMGMRTCFCSTDGIYLAKQILTTKNTTPSIEELCDVFKMCGEEGITHIVMEVSSHALSQYRINGIQFDTFVYTNLGHDHLDYHASFMDYRDAKEKGGDYIKEDGLAVLSLDPMILSMASYLRVPFICVGEGEYRYSYKWLEEGCSLLFREKEFLLPFCCDFQVSNWMLSMAVLLRYGQQESVFRVLEKGRMMPGRMECIYKGKFRIYVDYAHSVEAYEALGKSMRRFEGEKWIVFGLGGQRDKEKRAIIGKVVEQYFDKIVVTSDNSRNENPAVICQMIVEGMKKIPTILLNREEAIDYAISNIAEHGIIIVAGKGNETVIKVQDEMVSFQDAKVIRQLLVKRGFINVI